MKLASFDIFDTTLIRRCGKPENIFYLMAERLYPDDKVAQDGFVEWRKRCPGELQQQIKGREVMLEEIYERLQITDYRLQITDYSQQLVEMEKGIEAENLMVNPAVKVVIDRYRIEGWQIAFISDMYLDSQFLREVLRREGCCCDGDLIYVSCECGVRKDLGTMYDFVRQVLNPIEWKHWGDNRRSDVKMAKEKGVDATWVESHYSDFEKKMLVDGDTKKSILTTYSRLARLEFGEDAYVALAADIVAPCYVAYVKWLLNDAQKRGIKRLYFLSRDGYILMKIAENMEHDGIELRYLFLSRRSLYLPYLCDGSEKEYLEIVDRHTLLRRSVNHMLWQLQIDRESLKNKYDIEFDYDKIVTQEQEQDFLSKIFKSSFYKDLQQRANAEKMLLLDYFEQEQLLEDVKSAMVDVGWLGTSRLMVNRILEGNKKEKIPFYYYGVRGDVFDSRCGEYYAFVTHWLNPSIVGFIENYMSASPYKTTIGYERRDNQIVPLFDNKQSCYSKIVDINEKVCSKIAQNIGEVNDEDMKWWAKETMESFSNFDSELDLSPLLDIEMFDDGYFVKKMTRRELFNHLFLGKTITSFDCASLQLTCGYKWGKRLSHIASYSGRLRGWLFRMLKKFRVL